MIGSMESLSTTFSDSEHIKVEEVLNCFCDILGDICRRAQIPRASVPFLRPSNFSVVVDPMSFHLIVDESRASGLPEHHYLDHRAKGKIFSHDSVVQGISGQYGYEDPISAEFPVEVLDSDAARRDILIRPTCVEISQSLARDVFMKSLGIPSAFAHLERHLRPFLSDHPDYDRNVFLMMRFEKGEQYAQIADTVRSCLKQFNLNVLRADDKAYDEDLWDNVCTYMLGCAYGIAIFEEIDKREFNPNVTVELGFMMALGKRCLLVKDRRMPKMPADIVGKLYRPFDTYHIKETLTPELEAWVHDIGLK